MDRLDYVLNQRQAQAGAPGAPQRTGLKTKPAGKAEIPPLARMAQSRDQSSVERLFGPAWEGAEGSRA